MRKKKIAAACGVCTLLVAVLVLTVPYMLMCGGKRRLMSHGEGAELQISGMTGEKAVTEDGTAYRYDDSVINILCLGTDSRGDEEDNGQADAIALISVSADRGEVTCIGINRDSIAPVKVYGVSGKYIATEDTQIALSYAYGSDAASGCELAAYSVSELLRGIPIHGVVQLDIDGISELNKAVGGVTLTALEDVDKADIKSGENVTLTDEQAMLYVTERNSASDEVGTNAARMERQKQYMTAWLARLRTSGNDTPGKLYSLYQSMSEYMYSGMDKWELMYLAGLVMRCDTEDISMQSVPGSYGRTAYYDEYEVDEQELEALLLDVFFVEAE